MLLRWPRCLPANRTVSSLISNADLATTLCQLAGLDQALVLHDRIREPCPDWLNSLLFVSTSG